MNPVPLVRGVPEYAAQIWHARLDEAGIWSYVVGGNEGGAELHVRAEDVEDAVRVLRESDPGGAPEAWGV